MDTIGMDIYPLVAGDADTVVDVVTWHHRTLPLGQREGNPPPGPCFTARGGQANDGQNAHLRTVVRRVIIRLTKLRSHSQATNTVYGC